MRHSSDSLVFTLMKRPPHISTLFPYTTLFRSRSLNDRRLNGVSTARRIGVDYRESACSLAAPASVGAGQVRSEEHTSELQSLRHLVCRLLLEKKKDNRLTHSESIVGVV